MLRQFVVHHRKQRLARVLGGMNGGIITIGFRRTDKPHQDHAVRWGKRLVCPVHPFFALRALGWIFYPQPTLAVLRGEVSHDGVRLPQRGVCLVIAQ